MQLITCRDRLLRNQS